MNVVEGIISACGVAIKILAGLFVIFFIIWMIFGGSNMETTTKTIEELIETGESPLDINVIPNHMGINLCSVEAITWTRQEDGQLVSLTIHFIPADEASVRK